MVKNGVNDELTIRRFDQSTIWPFDELTTSTTSTTSTDYYGNRNVSLDIDNCLVSIIFDAKENILPGQTIRRYYRYLLIWTAS